MVFSSPIFLFGFLPLVLLAYYASPRVAKNLVLLAASLLFYAWGEVFYVGVMLVSIGVNFAVGQWIGRTLDSPKAKLLLAMGVVANLVLLVSFKYANFIADNMNWLLAQLHGPTYNLDEVHLPLGISFFTFQALSYLVDVYRREVPAQKNLFDLALYISLFPQLIAGPIVRYHDVAQQIRGRNHSIYVFASGVERFVYGLAKKMLIANPLGAVADAAFGLSGGELTMPLAWIGILAYSLQIYFDFSGYSDMAIGLGRMFGFRFLENFNYPYISRSLREFWRRWHISLSTWFRDYVYIPLGGSRVVTWRVYTNLLIVFVLTGFWHGASWNFLIWGLFHGAFLAAEHAGFSRVLAKAWAPVQHIYALLVVMVAWVFFRAETLPDALAYLSAMTSPSAWQTTGLQYAQILTHEALLAFVAGLVLVTPIYRLSHGYLMDMAEKRAHPVGSMLADIPRMACLFGLFYVSCVKIAASTYNPFIYFRF